MARIRTIKPEFWQDEKLAPLAPIDRLVFLGLIGMADDTGRLLDNTKVIDAFIFPATEHSAAPSVDRLAQLGRVKRGVTGSGQRVIQIVRWDHQKIDKPNLSSALPPIADDSPTPPRPVADASPTHTCTGTDVPTTDDHSVLSEPANAERKENFGTLMGAIRKFGRLGGDPDKHDGSILKRLVRKRKPSEIRDALEGLRRLVERDQIKACAPGNPFGMALLDSYQAGVAVYQLALDAFYAGSANTEKRGGTASISDLLKVV